MCDVSIFHIFGKHVMALYLVWTALLRGSFWIRVVFSLAICSGPQFSVCIYSFQSQDCRVLKLIFKPKSVYAIKARVFRVCYLFKYCLEPVGMYVHLSAFFEQLQLSFQVYLFGFLVMIFPFSYVALKPSCLSRIRLLTWLRPFLH